MRSAARLFVRAVLGGSAVGMSGGASRARAVAATSITLVAATVGAAATHDAPAPAGGSGEGSYLAAVSRRLPPPPPSTTTTAVALPKPLVLFVLGGPGAGKGTQCARLVRNYGYVHLSAGDLLREERDSGSPDGAMIEAYIREGKIVPVEVTVNLIKKAMAKSGGSKFLVDGFPRNFNNLEGWQSVMGGDATVQGVLMYEVPEAVMEARLLERGKTSGRSDDQADVIRKRFRTYMDSTLPVVAYYDRQGKVYRVNGNQGVDAVYADTERVLRHVIEAEVLEANHLLLRAVHAGAWDIYAALSHPELTAIEAESNGEVVKGLDFHKYYFDKAAQKRAAAGSAAPTSRSTLTGVDVKLVAPKVAVVAANRMVQRPDRTDMFGETRVWSFIDGRWKQVHFHRSPAGATAGALSATSAAAST